MNQKIDLTRYVLKELGKRHDDEYVKDMLVRFWVNSRQKDSGGLRLTEDGYNWLKEADIKDYQIDIPKGINWTNQLIITGFGPFKTKEDADDFRAQYYYDQIVIADIVPINAVLPQSATELDIDFIPEGKVVDISSKINPHKH